MLAVSPYKRLTYTGASAVDRQDCKEVNEGDSPKELGHGRFLVKVTNTPDYFESMEVRL